jgi:pSer/pThr/pTyr-binding forkhead associated (FHA) protein
VHNGLAAQGFAHYNSNRYHPAAMSAFGTLILHLADGREQRFALSKPTVHAGRAATSDVLLRDGKVSRQHARFECSDAGCTIVDLGSANGTFFNDRRITQAQLAHGDAIRMGDSILRYEVGVRTDEPDITLMDTPADVEKTLVEAHIATELNDTTQPRLVIVAPGWTWEVLLTAQALSLGRHADNNVDLEFPNVSRRHARVERRGDDLVLRDLGSANGTWVNGARDADPANADVQASHAFALAEQGQADEAFAEAQKALALGADPNNPLLQYAFGIGYKAQGKAAEAKAAFEAVANNADAEPALREKARRLIE